MRVDEDPTVQGLQEVLAGEHAALYAYSLIAARLDAGGPEADNARAAYDAHRTRRDTVTGRLRDLGEQPVVAEPGYALPLAVEDATSARAVAAQVEDRCAVLYATLVATAKASSPERSLGVKSLVDAATRVLQWGGRPTAFPGVGQP